MYSNQNASSRFSRHNATPNHFKRSCSEGIDERSVLESNAAAGVFGNRKILKRNDREKVAMLEKICDSVANQIVKLSSQ